MASLPQAHLTVGEYLLRERQASTRSEYFRGEVFAMPGATRRHNLITTNVSRELSIQLKEKPCEVYSTDMRVKVSDTGLYTYPDVLVVCGQPRFEDEHEDTLLNPIILIEVLSPSTEEYDRGQKFTLYRALASLREYVLISQDRVRIERYERSGSEWVGTQVDSTEESLSLPSIGCCLAVAEVYAKVALAAET